MNNSITNWIGNQVTGYLFAASISLVFMVIKLVLRHFTHLAIRHKQDVWAAIVWFGVDVSVFTLSLCIASNIPNKKGLTYQQTTWWYVVLIVCTGVSAFCYARFMKRKKLIKLRIPLTDFRSFSWLSAAWFFGYAFFLPTLGALAN